MDKVNLRQGQRIIIDVFSCKLVKRIWKFSAKFENENINSEFVNSELSYIKLTFRKLTFRIFASIPNSYK